MVAQDMNSKMGKVLEIDLNTRDVKIISLGHRNPEGLIVTTDGTLLSTEHGPAGGDELNVIVEGANYGWPIVTFGTDYGSYGWHGTKFVGEHAGYKRQYSLGFRRSRYRACFRSRGSIDDGTAICWSHH